MPSSNNFFKTACYFEAILILIAVFLGWIAAINPFENLIFSENAMAVGLLATLPLWLLFLAMQLIPYPSVQAIKALLLESLGPGLYRCHWTDFFILALIAGFSEELLFRGVIQPWMENAWGGVVGLFVSNLLFGLVHAVTPLYAVLATAVGIYLGYFLDYGEQRNLLIPIVIHSFYDFLAFVVIIRTYRSQLNQKDE